jgi:hypothetical protein
VKIWDDTLDAPVGTDGRGALVGYLGSRDQAERWHAAGFGIPSAVDRYQAFTTAWDAAKSEERADAIVREFYQTEAARAGDVGITGADPDFWRFAAAPKHYEFA